MTLNWKTIDKLEAKIPGVNNGYKGELCEFEVRLGRDGTPLHLSEHYSERFRIENKKFEIEVEAPTLHEAKELLRQKLAASEDYGGKWALWMRVQVASSGLSLRNFDGESASCSISVMYVLELTTRRAGKTRKRHIRLDTKLPVPYVGEFSVPTTHKELSQLRDGPAKPKPGSGFLSRTDDDVWREATPELVATMRTLQALLGASGDKVRAALSKKQFEATLEAVRSGQSKLLTDGMLKGE